MQIGKREPHWIIALRYLRQYEPSHAVYVAPPDLTQDGIAKAIGISRPRATIVINQLVDMGFAEKRLIHIEGGARRKNAYVITSSGVMAITDIESSTQSQSQSQGVPFMTIFALGTGLLGIITATLSITKTLEIEEEIEILKQQNEGWY